MITSNIFQEHILLEYNHRLFILLIPNVKLLYVLFSHDPVVLLYSRIFKSMIRLSVDTMRTERQEGNKIMIIKFQIHNYYYYMLPVA